MAVSSTTGFLNPSNVVIPPSLITPSSKLTPYTNTTNKYGRVGIRKNARNFPQFKIRNSDEGATSSTTETWEGGESDESVEVAEGRPPSLISALNVEKAFRGIPITDVDHYGRLGLQRGCSYELVGPAYQNRVKEVSSQGLEDEALNQMLEELKVSYRILSTEVERKLYDWSLARNGSPERYTWPFEVDLTQTSVKGTPPAQEPENVGPTIAVGYFFLGWLVVGFTLSIALNLRS